MTDDPEFYRAWARRVRHRLVDTLAKVMVAGEDAELERKLVEMIDRAMVLEAAYTENAAEVQPEPEADHSAGAGDMVLTSDDSGT
ncbi:hypothetical protein BH11ACT6_BH11ACT6_53430 [soil metagenome]